MLQAEKSIDGGRDRSEFGVVAGKRAVSGSVVALEVVAGETLDDGELVFEWLERFADFGKGVVRTRMLARVCRDRFGSSPWWPARACRVLVGREDLRGRDCRDQCRWL